LRGVGVSEGSLRLWQSVQKIASCIEILFAQRISLDSSVDFHHLTVDDQLLAWRRQVKEDRGGGEGVGWVGTIAEGGLSRQVVDLIVLSKSARPEVLRRIVPGREGR
jgi:hypothetical protein